MEKIRATQVSTKALKIRKQYLGSEPHQPICPYALCDAMGLDLRFVKIPSFEGMYIAEENLVLISSDRPEGRKRFTCAHEIGHHVLGHGTIIDEIVETGSNNEEEQEADHFACVLLMPPSAVSRMLQRYGVTAENMSPCDAYSLSKYFGVSYSAFLSHIFINLRIINYKKYQDLKKKKLPSIRKSLSGLTTNAQIVSVGEWWDDRAVDIEVGDYVVSQSPLHIDGPEILTNVSHTEKFIYQAVRPGITRIYSDSWSCFAKVSRYKFHGFYQYRYDEDEE